MKESGDLAGGGACGTGDVSTHLVLALCALNIVLLEEDFSAWGSNKFGTMCQCMGQSKVQE